MNRKRNLLSAACLGLVGTLLLIGYVRAAEGKASAGQQLVPVVVVRDAVPRGATVDELRDALVVKQVPADAKAEGSFGHLDDIGQRLPATELFPGEQLVAGRLGAPDEVGHELPEGTTAVSLSLEPQRAIGGLLRSGTRVNVLVSYDEPASTGTVLRDVAVESVVEPEEGDGTVPGTTPILVTFSVTPADAEKLVYAADHGKIWLAGAANVDLVPKVEAVTPAAPTSGAQAEAPEAPVTAVEAALVRIDTELAAPVEPGVTPVVAERRTIVVLSPKGGVGRTTVATNLAVALARRSGVDVGLLDLSLAFGDVASAMLLDPRHGLADLVRLPRPLSPGAVSAALTRHASGVHVLTAPENPVDGEEFVTDDIACVFEGLGALPRLVVDTPAGLDANTLVAVEHATDLVLVATLDVPTLLGLRQAIVLLERLGIARAKRHLVLSRDGLRNGIDRGDVEGTLGLPVTVSVPDERLVAASTNEGHPIVETAPRSPAARAFDQLAAAIEGDEPTGRPRRSGRRRRLET